MKITIQEEVKNKIEKLMKKEDDGYLATYYHCEFCGSVSIKKDDNHEHKENCPGNYLLDILNHVEKLVQASQSEGESVEYTNGYLAQYAQNLIKKLR